MNTDTKTKFFVSWRGYAVRFIHNHCGKVYSLVADEEATLFNSQLEAAQAATGVNLRGFEIEDVE